LIVTRAHDAPNRCQALARNPISDSALVVDDTFLGF